MSTFTQEDIKILAETTNELYKSSAKSSKTMLIVSIIAIGISICSIIAGGVYTVMSIDLVRQIEIEKRKGYINSAITDIDYNLNTIAKYKEKENDLIEKREILLNIISVLGIENILLNMSIDDAKILSKINYIRSYLNNLKVAHERLHMAPYSSNEQYYKDKSTFLKYISDEQEIKRLIDLRKELVQYLKEI